MRIIHLQVCVVTHAVLLLAGERQSAERSGAAHIPDARQVVVVKPAVGGLVAHTDNGEQPPYFQYEICLYMRALIDIIPEIMHV